MFYSLFDSFARSYSLPSSLIFVPVVLHAFSRFMLVALFYDFWKSMSTRGIRELFKNARCHTARCWPNTNEPLSLSTLHSSWESHCALQLKRTWETLDIFSFFFFFLLCCFVDFFSFFFFFFFRYLFISPRLFAVVVTWLLRLNETNIYWSILQRDFILMKKWCCNLLKNRLKYGWVFYSKNCRRKFILNLA